MKEIDIFVSAVSREFGNARQELVNRLRQILGHYGTIHDQESLYNEPSLQPNTVRRLIDHVHQSELVICLIGVRAGSPDTAERRKEILALAKEILAKQHNKQFDSEVDAWEQEQEGVTYTQLEYFLAKLWAKESKKRLVLLLPEPTAVENAEKTGSDPHQLKFVQHVKKNSERFERGYIPVDPSETKTVVLNALQHSLDYVLFLHRVSEICKDQQTSADRMLLAGMEFLGAQKQEKRLSYGSFNDFYRYVFTNWNASIPALIGRCLPQHIWRLKSDRPLLAARNADETLVVCNTERGTHALRCRNDGEFEANNIISNDQEERYFGCSQDLQVLLAVSRNVWYLVNTQSLNQRYEIATNFKPDAFGALPVVFHDRGNVWIGSSADGPLVQVKGNNTPPPSIDNLCEVRLFYPSTATDEKATWEVLVGAAADGQTNTVAVTKIDDVALRRFFLVSESSFGSGYCEGLEIVENNSAFSIALRFNTNGNTQTVGITFPLFGTNWKSGPLDFTVKYSEMPFRDSNAREYQFEDRFSYTWLSDKEHLVIVRSAENGEGAKAELYRFPRPLDHSFKKFEELFLAAFTRRRTVSTNAELDKEHTSLLASL